MTSSNRHWPSMFKSKPCNSPHHHHHHQWQHDLTNPSPLLSAGCTHRSPYSTSGCDERSPDPKPRWNPKPEQIRILEAIFNSGMVNPPRDEIRKIRAQLQEYGQVGDANVFYWFQNRKSRSKHKLRHLHNSKQQTLPAAANSSVASSEKPAPPPPVAKGFDYIVNNNNNNNKTSNLSLNSFSSAPTNTTLNLHQQSNFFQPSTENEFLTEPFMFPGGGGDGGGSGGGVVGSGGFGFSELTSVVHQQTVGSGSGSNSGGHQVGPCTNLLLNELMSGGGGGLVGGGGAGGGVVYNSKRDQQHHDFLDQKMKKILHPHLSYSTLTTTISKPHSPITSSPTTVPFTVAPPAPNQIQGNSDESENEGGGGGLTAGGGVPARSMVFINDVPFEVAVGPVNVREAFGEGAVLINSSGQPVLTNEWGVTLQSLQHAAFYYLI